jgi:hypothetical protein
MKVLVTASVPISADRLWATLGDETDDAEIMVVAPALHRSALRFLLSDAAAERGRVVDLLYGLVLTATCPTARS